MTSQEQTNNASGNQSVKGGRIVAGIDGSPVTDALEWPLASRVHGLFAGSRRSLGVATSFGCRSFRWYDPRVIWPKRSSGTGKLRPLIPTCVNSKVVEGHPAPVLIHESVGADLLVVGSRGMANSWDVDWLNQRNCVAMRRPVVVIRRTLGPSSTRGDRRSNS